ncbi:MAG: ISNCY family transposase [Anaerolineaceae bacterium]|nr:ISNCY family transposase [Anaerolineaceae bacterium]
MKWTIAMTQEELKRKTIIERAIDKRITQKEGAGLLQISERHFRRITARYRHQGDLGLVSGHRGKPGNRRLAEDKREQINKFIKDPLHKGFKPTFMMEKLEEYKGIEISKETMRQIMIAEDIHEAKVRKKKIHPPRERKKQVGDIVQIDGSYHAWLEDRGPKACLLLFVDDATSAVLGAEFTKTESFFAYAKLCKSYFRSKGLPKSFYSDRFSVFKVNTGEKEGMTQFLRAMNTLGIEMIYASSPQAKGRVERANQTFQDRLVKEMRLRNICTYQAANAYLPEFIKQYNRKFAVLPQSMGDNHAPLDTSLDLDFLFSVHRERTITKDLLIHYGGKTYQINTKRPPQNLIKRQVLITEDEKCVVSAYLNGDPLDLILIQKQPKVVKVVSTKSYHHHSYTPPVNHPWRTYGKKINGRPIPST